MKHHPIVYALGDILLATMALAVILGILTGIVVGVYQGIKALRRKD